MTPESNTFEAYLKDYIPREVFVKLCLRTGITSTILLLVASQSGFSFFDHFAGSVNAIDKPIRIFVPLIVLLSTCALMFKDLEHAFPEKWSQVTSRGAAGAFVRSCAAELLLWQSSVFIGLILLVGFLTVAIPSAEITSELLVKLFTIIFYLSFCVVFFISAYLLVRRNGPPLADSKKFTSKFSSPTKMITFYCVNFLAILALFAAIIPR